MSEKMDSIGVPEHNLEKSRTEVMNFNFNNYVSVKLTSGGKRLWEQYYINLGLNPKDYKHKIKPDSEGFSKIQLVDLIKIFGSAMYMGNGEKPFEMDFKIEVDRPNTMSKQITDTTHAVVDVLGQQ